MKSMSSNELIDLLDHKMIENKDDKKAVNMAAYLKNKFDCYGIKSPVRNEFQREWFNAVKSSDADIWDLIYRLWDKDQREYQYVAIDLMKRIPKKDIKKEDYKYLEELITSKSWWDTVDSLASNYGGRYFEKFPEMKEKVIGRWRQSDDFWLNRTCLIFQLKYKDKVDFDLLKDLIIQFLPNREFFIQKAIGWSLRQYSKFNPEGVRQFLKEVKLDGVALREASKYI